MNEPETIDQFLEHIEDFAREGRKINATDLSHDAKLSRLMGMMETYGLA